MLRRRLLMALPLAGAVAAGGAFYAILNRAKEGRFNPYGLDNPLIGHNVPISTPPLPNGVLIVNFFASWCAPCREEIPALQQLKRQGSQIIGVAYKDTRDGVGGFLTRNGNPYDTLIWDDDGRLGIDWGLSGVPETYLLDRDHIVRRRWAGAIDPDGVQAVIGQL